ncbi:MAG: hypothetical protein SFT68_04705 [Rickettsiaceae bacterium]|nr:hypothetical protein [Rickettsiaceae bacterium]
MTISKNSFYSKLKNIPSFFYSQNKSTLANYQEELTKLQSNLPSINDESESREKSLYYNNSRDTISNISYKVTKEMNDELDSVWSNKTKSRSFGSAELLQDEENYWSLDSQDLINNQIEQYDEGPSLSSKSAIAKDLLKAKVISSLDNDSYDSAYKNLENLVKLHYTCNELFDANTSSYDDIPTSISADNMHQVSLLNKIMHLIKESNELNSIIKEQIASEHQEGINDLQQYSDSASINETLAKANGVAKSTILEAQNYDDSTITYLLRTISNLTQEIKDLKSEISQNNYELEYKFSAIRHEVTPVIQNNMINLQFNSYMQRVKADHELYDYYTGFTKTFEKYCIGAYARTSGAVSSMPSFGILELVKMVPGSEMGWVPFEVIIGGAMQINKTNTIKSAIMNMPSFNITMHEIIPNLSLEMTLCSQNALNIHNAKLNQFESFIKAASGILWKDDMPNPQFLLGANQALWLIKGLEKNKIDFNNSIAQITKEALNYLFKNTSDSNLQESDVISFGNSEAMNLDWHKELDKHNNIHYSPSGLNLESSSCIDINKDNYLKKSSCIAVSCSDCVYNPGFSSWLRSHFVFNAAKPQQDMAGEGSDSAPWHEWKGDL